MILSRPVSYSILLFLLTVSSFIAIIFMISTDYIKKERVTGVISPELGTVAVFPPKTGILTRLNITEGKRVEKNDELCSILIDQRTAGGEYIGLRLIEELNEQENYLKRQVKLEQERVSTQISARKTKAEQLKIQIMQIKGLLNTRNENLELEAAACERARIMFSEGFISSAEVESYRRRYLDQKQQAQTLEMKLEEAIHDLEQIPLSIKELEVNSGREISKIENQFSELAKQRAQVEGQRQLNVYAPVSGLVTSVNVNAGQKLNMSSPLFSIIPANSSLQVNLYLPTRSIGFVETGQEISIRYEAFPYQKFGTYSGEISQISKSVILPGEVTSGLTFGEPVYKAAVRLKSQHIKAYGREIRLKPGMMLSADVILDRRSIFEWLLEPLYSLRGKI